MPSVSLILPDDYLWAPDTKHACDIFFVDPNCVLLSLSVGQGISFKKGENNFYCLVRVVVDAGAFRIMAFLFCRRYIECRI